MKNKLKIEMVKSLLQEHPVYRDNDRELITHMWRIEILNSHMPLDLILLNALTMKSNGKYILSSPETIRRTRQKVQELYPELRGNVYQERKKHSGEWKKELLSFENIKPIKY